MATRTVAAPKRGSVAKVAECKTCGSTIVLLDKTWYHCLTLCNACGIDYRPCGCGDILVKYGNRWRHRHSGEKACSE